MHPGFELTLSDATPILVRPVLPSDHDGIRQGFREMSRTAKYMRFFTAGSEMSSAQARYFTEVDQRDHVAWCAVEPGNRRGYGISRFVRDRDRRDRAEFAIAVIDPMQGKGLGAILLATLYLLAQEGGIRELWSEVLPDNPVIPHWLPQLGAHMVGSGDLNYRIVRWQVARGDESPTDSTHSRQFADWLGKLRPLVVG